MTGHCTVREIQKTGQCTVQRNTGDQLQKEKTGWTELVVAILLNFMRNACPLL